MLRAKLLIVSVCVAAFSAFGVATPAFASDCSGGGGDTDLSGVCQAAAKVVCKFVAGGNPCLD